MGISERNKFSELRFYLIIYPPHSILTETDPFGQFPRLLDRDDMLSIIGL